jgi:hypothetical protein
VWWSWKAKGHEKAAHPRWSGAGVKGARVEFWPSARRMPPVPVDGGANCHALDEDSMLSLPVEDLEDAIASRGTGRRLSPVLRIRLRSFTQALQRVSVPGVWGARIRRRDAHG